MNLDKLRATKPTQASVSSTPVEESRPTEVPLDEQARQQQESDREFANLNRQERMGAAQWIPGVQGETLQQTVLARTKHLFNLVGGLVIGFLFFYVLADYTSYTTTAWHPGQVVFSNTMIQLWTATYRLAFVLGISLLLLRLFWPELWQFFRPDRRDGPDLDSTLRFEITPFQRLCVFLIVFFSLCLLFVLLLSVNLPDTISVGR